MRKKIAALLATLMCILAFTGCSKAELSYLQMSVDMMQNMKVVETKGTTTITIDFDALEKFMEDTAKSMGGSGVVLGECPMKGKETLQLDYVMTMDVDNMQFVFDVDAKHKGNTYDFGKVYYGVEGMYASSQTFQGVYDLMKATLQPYQDNYMFSDAYEKEYKAVLAQNEYICLYDMKDLGMTDEQLKAMTTPVSNDVYKAVFDLYKNAFSGFSTDMVTEILNGFRIEAKGEQVGQLLVSMLNYMIQNPEPVLKAFEEYMVAVSDFAGLTAQDLVEIKDAFAEMKTELETFSQTLTQAKDMFAAVLQQTAVKNALQGFSYKAEITKNNDVYIATEDYVMGDVCTIHVKATSQKATSAITFPANAASAADFGRKMSDLVEKYNPIVGVNAMWVLEDESKEAYLSKERKDTDLLFHADIVGDTLSYVVENGRVYLPLRDICDELGVSLVWDKNTKTASAYTEKENADKAVKLETKLVDGTSYVGVREFEKLGYTITYTNTDGIHEATITKTK